MSHSVHPKTELVTVRLTPKQREMIDARAKRCGLPTSVWLRSIALQCAAKESRPSERGYLRIEEPNGATT